MVMALRILSGMVFIPNGGTRSGTVEISFTPFALANTSNPVFELRKRSEVGASGRFTAKPASIVAPRQFGLLEVGTFYRVNVDSTVTRDVISIRWKARGSARVDQEEIGFMVVGEVPDGPVTRPPGPTTPVGDGRPSNVQPRKRAPKRPGASKRIS